MQKRNSENLILDSRISSFKYCRENEETEVGRDGGTSSLGNRHQGGKLRTSEHSNLPTLNAGEFNTLTDCFHHPPFNQAHYVKKIVKNCVNFVLHCNLNSSMFDCRRSCRRVRYRGLAAASCQASLPLPPLLQQLLLLLASPLVAARSLARPRRLRSRN